MKLSVIITSYKFKDYIKQCVDSVLSQNTDFSFEVLIRDDGTNDGTYEMLRETYKTNPKVRILDSSTNVGAIENLRLMVKESRGVYVAHIDGDDYLIDNQYYQRAVSFLDSSPSYALYCSGCKYLQDGVVTPPDHWIISGKPDFKLSDMLVENYTSFGRVFRKTEFKKEIFEGIPYPDWVFNFEILKKGNGWCETGHCAGIYRIHQGGMFSTTDIETKQKNRDIIRKELSERYAMLNQKVITIIDCFVHNDRMSDKLLSTVKWMKEDGHDVLLVSNTPVSKDIIENVKFYVYDNRNQLFEKNYKYNNYVDFWKYLDPNLEVHDFVPEKQPHGLSVLINLFNAILYAKQQGYTHFQRLEVDGIFGKLSREHIKQIPKMCVKNGKKGLFYYNDNKSPQDISFHYFYCEIDEFLSKFKRISCEQDYEDYLKQYYGDNTFQIVEVFMRDNLRKNGDENMLLYTGADMNVQFPDTRWNTETSISSFGKKYKGCTTKLYHVHEYDEVANDYKDTGKYILFSHSHKSEPIARTISIERKTGEMFECSHDMGNAGHWTLSHLGTDIESMSVYENGEFLYKENSVDCASHIKILKQSL